MRKFSHVHTCGCAQTCDVHLCKNTITNSENKSQRYSKQIVPPLPILNIYFTESKKLLKVPGSSNQVLQLTCSEVKEGHGENVVQKP